MGPESEISDEGPTATNPDRIQEIVQKHFKVYEVERAIRGLPAADASAYFVQFEPATFPARFDALREEVRGLDPNLLVMHQHRLGEDVILVARKPPIVDKGPGLNIFLLIATIVTTTLSGAFIYMSYGNLKALWVVTGVDLSYLHPTLLGWGFLTFSLPLVLILGIHEIGHYVVAKRHRVKTTLPYFIPVPPPLPFGTFGAFISMKEPIPDRKALFDIGASGPVAGFLCAIPVLIVGMILTATIAKPIPPEEEFHLDLDWAAPTGHAQFGFNETSNASLAHYETGHRSDAGRPIYWERIRVNTSDYRNASGTPAPPWAPANESDPGPLEDWTLRLNGANLTARHSLHVRIEFGVPNASEWKANVTKFGNETFHEIDLALDPHNETTERLTYAFQVPLRADNVTILAEWGVPSRGLINLGESLAFKGLQWSVEQVYPLEKDVYIHPTALAGWVGLLVTGFNLLPAGTLDGGHVARAILGDKMKWASYAAIALMVALSLKFTGWLIMAILVVFLGANHPPPLNDRSPLDGKRKVWAFLVVVLLAITFIPFPFQSF